LCVFSVFYGPKFIHDKFASNFLFFLCNNNKNEFQLQQDPTTVFWAKVERIFGEIPPLIKLILEFNGFDTHLALKGIRWDDKSYFFGALEESLMSLAELDDSDSLKKQISDELAANHQKFEGFRLKLGHKNLIINLCHELQKTNLEDFNGKIVKVADVPRVQTELVVRKAGEEHGYSRDNENNLKRKRSSTGPQIITIQQSPLAQQIQEVPVQEGQEFIYETEDEEGSQFMEQEFLEELDTFEQEEAEIVEYQEIQEEVETDENGIYTTEQIIKSEADQYEQANECFEISGYESSSSINRSGPPKTKKPKHMYTSEFLQKQMTQGRIGTPGRRRPKLQRHYPDTEEGLLERWSGESANWFCFRAVAQHFCHFRPRQAVVRSHRPQQPPLPARSRPHRHREDPRQHLGSEMPDVHQEVETAADSGRQIHELQAEQLRASLAHRSLHADPAVQARRFGGGRADV
jgi:hypothetical protein